MEEKRNVIKKNSRHMKLIKKEIFEGVLDIRVKLLRKIEGESSSKTVSVVSDKVWYSISDLFMWRRMIRKMRRVN